MSIGVHLRRDGGCIDIMIAQQQSDNDDVLINWPHATGVGS